MNNLRNNFSIWVLANLSYDPFLIYGLNWRFKSLHICHSSFVDCKAKYSQNQGKSEPLSSLRKWRHTPACMMVSVLSLRHAKVLESNFNMISETFLCGVWFLSYKPIPINCWTTHVHRDFDLLNSKIFIIIMLKDELPVKNWF